MTGLFNFYMNEEHETGLRLEFIKQNHIYFQFISNSQIVTVNINNTLSKS